MKILNLLLVVFLISSCKEKVRKLPYYDTADFTPKWELPSTKEFHQIKPFTFITQENETFTEKSMDGKICVADFFFTTCPGICPKLATSMSGLQKEFLNDDDIQLISHTVTPDTDSVPILKKYAENNSINYKRWKLLTGKQSEIYELGRKYYFVEEDLGVNSDSSIFLHTENFVLVDKKRRIRGIYNGLDPNSMKSLKNDILVLKQE